ncbi:DUF6134 family protein [Mariniflexile sp. HNIBRBA6329]|uniref:DUF6134 family protein n=1 Tax=Mariniflexile sp. HNIBRBA6329 TaxID=3373088 RepID=UPI00374757CE
MIPVLILYVIKRLKKDSFLSKRIAGFKKLAIRLKLMFFLLVLTNSLAASEVPISKVITYNVLKNNVVIGTIKMNELMQGDSVTYTLESNIEAQYLLKFKITGKELSIFKEGILIHSSVFRKVNNKVKSNHSISLKNGEYNLESFDKTSILDLNPIKQNLVCMYFKEPLSVQNIFCDNLNKMVPVKAISNGVYKVEFSKGKYNLFHYKHGKCVKIEAFSPLFDVILIPAKS